MRAKQMRKIITKLLLIALAACCSTAYAGTYLVTFRPYFFNNQLYIEETNVQKSAVPACVTRPLLRLNTDTTTPEFKEQYAIILAAWYAERSIQITGTGACETEGDEIVLQIWPL